MIITPKLEYFIKADGTSRIFIYLYDTNSQTKAKIPTSYYVPPGDWAGSGVNKKKLQASNINPALNRIIHEIEEFTVQNSGLSPAQVKEWYVGSRTRFTPATYFRHYIDLCERGEILKKTTKDKLTEGYLETLRSGATHIEAYAKKHPLTFDGINEQFYNRLVNFLRSERKLSPNTLNKVIKKFKVMCAYAFNQGIHKNLKFKDYVVTWIKPQKIRLTPDEVNKIINLDLTNYPGLKPERDRFTVAYDLMLRFGDSVSILENHIVIKEGKPYLDTHAQKTKKPVLLPIKRRTYLILMRNNFKLTGVNQVSNRNLKKLGMLAGIDDPVTITEYIDGKKKETVYKKWELIETHTTRRSAARNMFDAGLAPEIIQVLGGWSTTKQMLEYIDIDLEYAASKAAEHPFFS